MLHQMNIYGKDRVQQAIERLQTFSKDMKRYLDLEILDKKIDGRKCRIFVRKEDE